MIFNRLLKDEYTYTNIIKSRVPFMGFTKVNSCQDLGKKSANMIR